MTSIRITLLLARRAPKIQTRTGTISFGLKLGPITQSNNPKNNNNFITTFQQNKITMKKKGIIKGVMASLITVTANEKQGVKVKKINLKDRSDTQVTHNRTEPQCNRLPNISNNNNNNNNR